MGKGDHKIKGIAAHHGNHHAGRNGAKQHHHARPTNRHQGAQADGITLSPRGQAVLSQGGASPQPVTDGVQIAARGPVLDSNGYPIGGSEITPVEGGFRFGKTVYNIPPEGIQTVNGPISAESWASILQNAARFAGETRREIRAACNEGSRTGLQCGD